jgi:NTE family protein
VIGTSAGSVVGTYLATGVDLRERYDTQLATSPSAERAMPFDLEELIRRFAEAAAGATTPQERLARIGALAVETPTVPEAERREIISARLPVQAWPERDLRITAIAADTGELVVFDRASGVELVDAVAASCAVPGIWPPVTIGGRRYIDGGTGSVTNADLAVGADRVLVLAPMRGIPNNPLGTTLDDALHRLRRHGSVVLVEADEESLAAFGNNPLDPAIRPPSAQAGRRQGLAVADAVRARWEPA